MLALLVDRPTGMFVKDSHHIFQQKWNHKCKPMN